MKRSLDRREQAGLAMGILAVTLVVMLALYVPAGPRKTSLRAKTDLQSAKDELQLEQMASLDVRDRLERQKQLMDQLARRKPDFSLFSHVDGLLNKRGLRSKAQLEQYKPRNGSAKQPMVQLRLQEVPLKELVSLLHDLYAGDTLVSVYKVDTMRPAPSGKGLDCDVTFMTITS